MFEIRNSYNGLVGFATNQEKALRAVDAQRGVFYINPSNGNMVLDADGHRYYLKKLY